MTERKVLYNVNIEGDENVKKSFKDINKELDKSQKESKELSSEYKKLDDSMGLVTSENKNVAKSSKKLEKEIKKQKKSTDNLNKSTSKYNNNLKQTPKSTDKAAGGVKKFGKASKAAMVGIVLVIATIIKLAQAVKNLVTRTEEGEFAWKNFQAEVSITSDIILDKIGDITRNLFNFSDESKGLGRVWKDLQTTFGTVLSDLQGKFKRFFEDPLEGLKSLYDGIDGFAKGLKDNVVGGITSVFETALANIERLVAGIRLNYERAVNLVTDNQDAVDAAMKSYEEATKKAQQANKEFTDDIKDTAAYKAINSAIQSVKDGVNDFTNDIKEAQDAAVALQERSNKLLQRNREQLVRNAKLDKQIAEARATAVELQESNIDKAIEAQERAIELERIKMNENLVLVREELEIAREKNKLADSTSADLEREARLEAQLIQIKTRNAERERTFNQRLITLRRKSASEEVKIEKQKNVQLNAIDEQYKNWKLEQQEQEFEQDEIEYTNKLEKYRKFLQNRNITLLEYDRLVAEAQAEFQKSADAKEIARYKKLQQEKKEATQKAYNDINNIIYQSSMFVNSLKELELAQYKDREGDTTEVKEKNAEKRKEIEKKYADIQFAITSAQIIASTAQGVMKAFGQGGTAGFVIGGIIAGIGVAQLALADQQRQQVQQLAHGGIIGGKPHSQGGTRFRGDDGSEFEAERGEYLAVVNKRDAKRAAMLDSVNSEHGKSFGINKSMYARGGMFTPRQEFQETNMRDVIRETVNEVARIPVVVSERDISDTQERVRRIEVNGDL